MWQKERENYGVADVVLLACEIAQFQAPTQTSFAVFLCCGEKQEQPVVYKGSAVATRRPKINEFDLPWT